MWLGPRWSILPFKLFLNPLRKSSEYHGVHFILKIKHSSSQHIFKTCIIAWN
jgi:hypothetical protein